MLPPRKKKGQNSWPGIILKKWFNISAKEYDFNSDELESESEIEDEDMDGEPSNDYEKRDEFRNQSTAPNSESSAVMLRRCKSETLRVQYIGTKELRICVGTWNAGGRLPPDDLDIKEWLDMEDPSDIYVLGLQEMVPLNAGNVFGAEDSHPVSMWECLIRETLNRIQPVNTKFKCYSDPPSPSRFKPAADVPVIEDVILPDSEDESDEKSNALNESSLNSNKDEDEHSTCRTRSRLSAAAVCAGNDGVSIPRELDSQKQTSQVVKKLDRLHQCGWVDYETNSEIPINQPKGGKLTKAYSGTEKIGSSWPELPLDLLAQHVLDRQKSFKAFNSFKSSLIREYWGSSEAALIPGTNLEDTGNRKRRSAFVRIVSKQMVGIFLSIWVRRSLRRHIKNLKVSTVGVGVMGYIGNKGSVSVSMSIYQTHFCFICSHLTSGEKDGDELRRNADLQEIQRRTQFNSVSGVEFPKSIHDHERIIWFGDLNYRINLSYEKTRDLISKKEWSKLIERDQLIRELKKGRALYGWSEGTLNFPPTYKYESNSDKYFGEDPRAGRRTPAWCDRVLSFGKGMRQLSYKRIGQKLSDHRPVTAVFMAEVEVLSHRKLQKVLSYNNADVEDGVVIQEMEMTLLGSVA